MSGDFNLNDDIDIPTKFMGRIYSDLNDNDNEK
jgi:hypothetical protein